ncbi:MAG: hypothetical protein JAY75_05335, partial [Candidatus Thiodiazotropha taylori]|nr:hypothetical protein [Candidatus Thiodiazotropha taylori]MCW4307630.1 hypothetical protein [Candidatus Thiodiazotropha endolucinida]
MASDNTDVKVIDTTVRLNKGRIDGDQADEWGARQESDQSKGASTSGSPTRENYAMVKKLKIPIPRAIDPLSDTCAAAILHEESADLCCVCDSHVGENANRCSVCTLICHDDCMCRDPAGIEKCLTCAASHLHNEATQLSSGQDPEATQEPISSPDGDTTIQQGPHSGKPSNETKADSAVNPNKPSPSETKSQKDKKGAQDTTGVKQRELRQQELKLRKWEEELKIREAKAAELENDKRRLEEYLCKTEARNVELEATVRTLQRRVSVLEHEHDLRSHSSATQEAQNPRIPNMTGQNEQYPFKQNFPTSTNPGAARANEDLLYRLQQRVNKFILGKVAQQIDRLEILDSQCYSTGPAETPASNFRSHSLQRSSINLEGHHMPYGTAGYESPQSIAPSFATHQPTNRNQQQHWMPDKVPPSQVQPVAETLLGRQQQASLADTRPDRNTMVGYPNTQELDTRLRPPTSNGGQSSQILYTSLSSR